MGSFSVARLAWSTPASPSWVPGVTGLSHNAPWENHFSKWVSCIVHSRIFQFPKILCWKMAHMKGAIDWALLSQPNIPVRLVPKSKLKFPAIMISWGIPMFWCFILLPLPLLDWSVLFFLSRKNLHSEQILVFQLQGLFVLVLSLAPPLQCLAEFWLWQRSLQIYTFPLLPKNTRTWMASTHPGGVSAPPQSVFSCSAFIMAGSVVTSWLGWKLKSRKIYESVKYGCWRR